MESKTFHIAEIPYENGKVKFRYSRYMSKDGLNWIRHGLFTAYYESGKIKSEVEYLDGLEHGPCIDYHESGVVAAKGNYVNGKEHGTWLFYKIDGTAEAHTKYCEGKEI